MVRLTTAAAFALISQALSASAWERDVLTIQGAVFCTSPFKLSEGITAANRGDEKWMKEIGCYKVKADIPVVLITPLLDYARPLQARLLLGDEAYTIWAFSSEFKTKKGGRLTFSR